MTSHARLLSLPAVPMIAGFDPRYQFIHVDDVVRALEFAVEHELPGIYNVAPDGVLALSEVIGLLGKRALPVLPPWGTGAGRCRAAARRASACRRRCSCSCATAAGSTTAGSRPPASPTATPPARPCMRFAEHLRLRSVLKGVQEPYRYEKEVEDFLRWSPSVREREAESHKPLVPGAR